MWWRRSKPPPEEPPQLERRRPARPQSRWPQRLLPNSFLRRSSRRWVWLIHWSPSFPSPRPPAGQGVDRRNLAQLAELCQLAHELRRIDWTGGILILQLRHQKLQKHIVQALAARQAVRASGRRGWSNRSCAHIKRSPSSQNAETAARADETQGRRCFHRVIPCNFVRPGIRGRRRRNEGTLLGLAAS